MPLFHFFAQQFSERLASIQEPTSCISYYRCYSQKRNGAQNAKPKSKVASIRDTISNWWLMYAEYVDIKEIPTAKSKE